MQLVHTQKFIRVSPRKLRLVAGVVRNMEPNKAVEILPYVGKRAALPIQKAIKTALANAKNQRISLSGLIIKEIQINEGPRYKRGRAVSKGSWHPYQRKTSHIRIVLEKAQELPTSASDGVKTRKETKMKSRIVGKSKKNKKVSVSKKIKSKKKN